ncbi:TPA_asm: hypothetical protein GNB46_002941 [Salmonella enterica subsp. enterica serovar Infantis]|uniref:Uncharacterized protein n=1 Tax=Salmonella enterica subsp. enterica serovar Infantis str. CFSAN000522 TaxID=1299258 RepID=A0A5Y7AIJ3_SALIN|nr:hypothetical protein [Salmonella enterica subsp. enterica serovar Infantis str. CFSAN000522]HAE6950562.1 hypothetical protein [Salmonella enterica subsp. enterica serovar Infantis]
MTLAQIQYSAKSEIFVFLTLVELFPFLVWTNIPPQCSIFPSEYGHSGKGEVFSPAHGVPPVAPSSAPASARPS